MNLWTNEEGIVIVNQLFEKKMNALKLSQLELRTDDGDDDDDDGSKRKHEE